MRKSTVLLCFACSALLSGCGTGSGLQNTALIAPANQVRGIVHGGQQPLSGAVIQLYPVGTTGYGSAGTGLISGAAQSTAGIALTDANGNFNITGKYTCPSASTLVYLTATGGNPGLLPSTTNNSARIPRRSYCYSNWREKSPRPMVSGRWRRDTNGCRGLYR